MAGLFYKSYSETLLASLTDESFRRVSITVYKIYLILLFSAIMATIGAVLNLVFTPGTSDTGLNFILTILTIWRLYTMNRQKQFCMFLTLLASSFFFGATTTSLISSFFSIDKRTIIIFFGGLVLMFCFHLFALRTHTIRVIYEINFFALPIFILSLIISIFFVFGVFPHDLFYVIPFVIAVPIIWHLWLSIFKDKIFNFFEWIPIHYHLLTVLSSFSHYHVFYLMGIYLFMLCVLVNLKLHTFDSIYLATYSNEHAPLPVSLSLTFVTEFIGRFLYTFINSGRTLYHHMGLRQKCQACCTLCAQVSDFCQHGLRISFNYIMNICKNVLDFVCAYSGQVRDYLVRITLASIGFAFFIILLILLLAGRV